MSKRYTILSNEYENIQTKPKRKPKWVSEDSGKMFHSFSQTELRTKNEILAEKKLSVIDLSFKVLDEKYKIVTDSFIYFFDLSGCTLWLNNILRNSIFYEGIEDPIMMHSFINFLERNEKHPDIDRLQRILLDYPNSVEFEQNITTNKGEVFAKCYFVSQKI